MDLHHTAHTMVQQKQSTGNDAYTIFKTKRMIVDFL